MYFQLEKRFLLSCKVALLPNRQSLKTGMNLFPQNLDIVNLFPQNLDSLTSPLSALLST